MLTRSDIELMGSLPAAERTKLPLAPGDDYEGSSWKNLINLRLEVDGNYLFWKTRGGSTLVNSFFGNILTVYPFQARVGGIITSYIAVHTAAGRVYLWDIDGASSDEIVNSGFSTTSQIQFAANGRLLFMLDYDAGQSKYHDLSADVTYDVNSYDQSYIESADLLEGDLTDDNFYGFAEDASVIVWPNSDGTPEFESYQAKITAITEGFMEWENPAGDLKTTVWGDSGFTETITDRNIVMPYSVDLDDLVGRPSNKQDDGAGGTEANEKYVLPTIYRQYYLLDVLNDGSVALSGRPHQLTIDGNDLFQNGVISVRLTVSSPASNVARRYLCATRWQATPQAAFVPSAPTYPNSPLFIVREINREDLFIDDATTDDDLIRPINELMPLPGGVPDLFGTGQISPHSIAQFGGSLLYGGYTINRPIPRPYTNPAAATNENVYVNITETTQLANNMALAFMFEYTDGKRSSVVQTEEFLQEGTASSTTPVACDQTKASATHTVTAGCSTDDTLTVTYQGETVNVPLTAASHGTPGAVASAIAAAVAADGAIKITSDVPSGSDVRYTERRYGEEFNTNVVDVDPATTGVTFNTQDPALAGGDEPEGTASKIYFRMKENYLGAGESGTHVIEVDGYGESDPFTINPEDQPADITQRVEDAVNDSLDLNSDWSAVATSVEINGVVEQVVLIQADVVGDVSYNGVTFSTSLDSGDFGADLRFTAPGGTPDQFSADSAGGAVGCLQAEASIDVSANNLAGAASEDHTITVDGNSTGAITINDTDTPEQIVDKYIAEIEATYDIDLEWAASKADQGAGVWRLLLTHREYGSVGNGKVVSIAGDVDVTVTVNSPSAGGDDAGEAVSDPGTSVNANRVQIHSLNPLVSKIYILGRTGSVGNYDFHPIREVSIEQAGAHGMEIGLPNTAAAVTAIEGTTFVEPSATDILTTVELPDYLLVATPFQQPQVSTQQRIVDQSSILRCMPIDYDDDKSTMRYRVMVFTDRNIQLGFLVDTTTDVGRVFDGDFEIVFDGLVTDSRQGVADVNGRIVFSTKDRIYAWSRTGAPEPIVDVRRYSVSADNNLVDVVYTPTHNEYWMFFSNAEILVFDGDTGSVRRMSYSGVGSIRAGAFFGGNFYIAGATDLMLTDVEGTLTDQSGGDSVDGIAETAHLGEELIASRLLEMSIGGEGFSAQLELDRQPQRFEGNGGAWSQSFNPDTDYGSKTLNIAGVSWSLSGAQVMPRFRITLPAASGGFVSHVILKHITTENKGKSRV